MTDTNDLFITASRKAFRYPSPKGDLTTEQLWALSLTQLDTIAKDLNTEVKAMNTETFIPAKNRPTSTAPQRMLVVLHIINTKVAEADKAAKRADNAAKRAKLANALAQRQDEAINNMSEADILKAMAETENDED